MTPCGPCWHFFGCYTQADGAAEAIEQLWDNAIEFADMISTVQMQHDIPHAPQRDKNACRAAFASTKVEGPAR